MALGQPRPARTAAIDVLRRPARIDHHDPARNILREFIAPGAAADLPEARLFNPGHSIEAAWLLWHAMERTGEWQYRQKILDILEGSLEFGWDRDYGGLYYFMDVEGKPPLQLEASMKLWWPHAEALYAALLAYTRTGEARWLGGPTLHEYTFRHFVDSPSMENGSPIATAAATSPTRSRAPLQGCFHVPRAADVHSGDCPVLKLTDWHLPG